MEYTITFTLLGLFCQVQAQVCVTPGTISGSPNCAPQIITTPIVATTIVDNSVSAALANALQLLIVSDIIETKLGASCLNNLVINPIEAPCYPRVEVIQPIAEYVTPIPPCASPIEVISPCRPIIEPYPYIGCPEIIGPSFGCNPYGIEVNPYLPNVCLPDVVTPRNYYNVAELLYPNFNYNGCGLEVIAPNPFAPVCGTEIVTLPCNNGCSGYRGYNELLTPIPYNSCGEIIIPGNPCGVGEIVPPCGPYYGGFPEVITPISPCNCGCYNNLPEFVPYGGLSELITPYPGCGVPEIISPCSPCYGGIPEVISPIYMPGCAGMPELLPNPYGLCRDVVSPCRNVPDVIIPTPCNSGYAGFEFCGPNAFAPNPIGSFAPTATEILMPPEIPVQLNCNFGYTLEGPCINFNVEPLPFGPGFCY